MERGQIVVKKKFIRKKRNIRKETKERTTKNSSKTKACIQEKIVTHMMKPNDSDHDSDRFLFMELDSHNETPKKNMKEIMKNKKENWILRRN